MKAIPILTLAAIGALASASVAKEARTDPVAAGQRVFDRNCLACHGGAPGYPPFAGLPGTEALRVKYKGEMPALLAERTDLTPELVSFFVRGGVSVMPPYRKTEISDVELAYLGAYLSRNNPDVKSGHARK